MTFVCLYPQTPASLPLPLRLLPPRTLLSTFQNVHSQLYPLKVHDAFLNQPQLYALFFPCSPHILTLTCYLHAFIPSCCKHVVSTNYVPDIMLSTSDGEMSKSEMTLTFSTACSHCMSQVLKFSPHIPSSIF